MCEHICAVLGNGIERMFEAKDLRAQGQNPHPSKGEGMRHPASFNRAQVESGAARKGVPPATPRVSIVLRWSPVSRGKVPFAPAIPITQVHAETGHGENYQCEDRFLHPRAGVRNQFFPLLSPAL